MAALAVSVYDVVAWMKNIIIGGKPFLVSLGHMGRSVGTSRVPEWYR